MAATGAVQGVTTRRQYSNASAADTTTWAGKSAMADWVIIIGSGSTVLVCEDGTSTTFTTDSSLPSMILPGPFSAFTSTTAAHVIMGNGPAPSAMPAPPSTPAVQVVQDAGTLAAGTATVNTGITITASSKIVAIRNNPDATAAHWGKLSIGTTAVGGPGTGSVVVNSANASDTSSFSLIIFG